MESKKRIKTNYSSIYDEIARLIPRRYNIRSIINEVVSTVEFDNKTPFELMEQYISDIRKVMKIISPELEFKNSCNILEDTKNITNLFFSEMEDYQFENDYDSLDFEYLSDINYANKKDSNSIIDINASISVLSYSKIDISEAKFVKDNFSDVYDFIQSVFSSGIATSLFYQMDILSMYESYEPEDTSKVKLDLAKSYFEIYQNFYSDLSDQKYKYSTSGIQKRLNNIKKKYDSEDLMKYLDSFKEDVKSLSSHYTNSIIDSFNQDSDGLSEYFLSTGFEIENMDEDISSNISEALFQDVSYYPIDFQYSINDKKIVFDESYTETINSLMNFFRTYKNIFNHVKSELLSQRIPI